MKRPKSDPGRAGRLAKVELEQTEEAFLRVREDLLEKIAETTPTQTQQREQLYFAVFALGRVKAALMAAANNAALDEYQKKIDQVMNAGS